MTSNIEDVCPTKPKILHGSCRDCPVARHFCSRLFSGDLSSTKTEFRICPLGAGWDERAAKKARRSYKECESSVVCASFFCFDKWVHGIQSDSEFDAITSFETQQQCAYADYKYFRDVFSTFFEASCGPSVTNWADLMSQLGIRLSSSKSISDDHATLWISSYGAHTPLHLDTYGCNIVVQLKGSKRWCLYETAPGESLRIPYEESSVYSNADPRAGNCRAPDVDVTLEEGDVLFVPRHWWHFVETVKSFDCGSEHAHLSIQI